jgi:isopentenyldiphosphate isomerase
MSTYRPLTIVNERDEVVGPADFATAQAQKLLRRCVDIFLFNDQGALLIQQRSATISYPNLYDKSAGGHVDFGDTYEATAYNEMAEELGVRDTILHPLSPSVRHDHYFKMLYVGVLTPATELQPDPHEVAAVAWWQPAELAHRMQTKPHIFIPNFVTVWQTYGQALVAKAADVRATARN